MPAKFSKYQVSTFIAILFHFFGLTGILFWKANFFIQLTPLNLILMFILLLWTQQEINRYFLLFALGVILTGFVAEVIGVNTGLLFGDYTYGNILGKKWLQVPLLIGLNWLIIIYCSGVTVHTFLIKTIKAIAVKDKEPPMVLKAVSVITDGAVLAVLFDWLMEPVAVKLGFWHWNGDGTIPFYNYVCWFFISVVLLIAFQLSPFKKENKFAINLLLIQVMFFLLLRTFLN